jgi:hypothetical protein
VTTLCLHVFSRPNGRLSASGFIRKAETNKTILYILCILLILSNSNKIHHSSKDLFKCVFGVTAQLQPQSTQKEKRMTEIRMTGEMRTDYDCETTGLPAEHWAEAVFQIGDEELVLEVSVEQDVIVAIMAGEDAAWKGTLEGLKKILKGEIKAR